MLALEEAERLASHHLKVATSLNKLGELYRIQGKLSEAKPFLQRALQIRQQTLGSEHPAVASSLNSLGEMYRAQKQFTKAEASLQQALSIRQKIFGLDHADVVASLMALAMLHDHLPQVRLWLEVDDGSGEHLEGAVPYEGSLAAAASAPPEGLSPDDLYVLYTGGTTAARGTRQCSAVAGSMPTPGESERRSAGAPAHRPR